MYTEQEIENELKKSTFVGVMEDELYNVQYEGDEEECFDTLFQICFNSDYPIVGNYWANEVLKKYKGATIDGVFGAIHDCKAYLDSEDLLESNDQQAWQDNPEALLAMLEYCAGEFYFDEALNKADLCIDDLVVDNVDKFEKALESVRSDNTIGFVYYVHDYLD